MHLPLQDKKQIDESCNIVLEYSTLILKYINIK